MFSLATGGTQRTHHSPFALECMLHYSFVIICFLGRMLACGACHLQIKPTTHLPTHPPLYLDTTHNHKLACTNPLQILCGRRLVWSDRACVDRHLLHQRRSLALGQQQRRRLRHQIHRVSAAVSQFRVMALSRCPGFGWW
jgi:hypothetical protein